MLSKYDQKLMLEAMRVSINAKLSESGDKPSHAGSVQKIAKPQRSALSAVSFAPKSGRCPVLYLVTLIEHPGVVKFGRTLNWAARRREYDNWNLRPGDAVSEFVAYRVTEEYVDLPLLERDLIANAPFQKRFGSEWFVAEFEDAARYLDRFLVGTGLAFDMF